MLRLEPVVISQNVRSLPKVGILFRVRSKRSTFSSKRYTFWAPALPSKYLRPYPSPPPQNILALICCISVSDWPITKNNKYPEFCMGCSDETWYVGSGGHAQVLPTRGAITECTFNAHLGICSDVTECACLIPLLHI